MTRRYALALPERPRRCAGFPYRPRRHLSNRHDRQQPVDADLSASARPAHRAHRPFFNILTHSAPLFSSTAITTRNIYTKAESGENPNNPLCGRPTRGWRSSPEPATGQFLLRGSNGVSGVDGGLREAYYAWEWGDALRRARSLLGDARAGAARTGIRCTATSSSPGSATRFARARRSTNSSSSITCGQTRGGVEVAPQFEWGGKERNGNFTFPQNRPTWKSRFTT